MKIIYKIVLKFDELMSDRILLHKERLSSSSREKAPVIAEMIFSILITDDELWVGC